MSEEMTTNPMQFFSENVDRWGAAEWFDRLVKAIREQDKAVIAMYAAADDDKATHEVAFQTYRNIAASSAMHLVRDCEKQVRAALSRLDAGEGCAPETNVLTDERRGVGIGMAIAAGIVMRSWGEFTQAREILGAAGLDTLEKLKASGVDQYDIDVLTPVLATLPSDERQSVEEGK